MVSGLFLGHKSPMRSLDFWTKFGCLLIALPSAAFLGSLPIVLLVLLISAILIRLSEVPVSVFWRHAKGYYISLTLGIMILSVLYSNGDLGSRVLNGLLLSLRFGILVTLGILFSMATDPMEIPIGLLRIRIPHRFGIVLMVGLRLMPLIMRKTTEVWDAQKVRGGKISLSPRGIRTLASRLLSLMVPVVYLTLEASVGMSDTLLSRGYDPDSPITIPPSHFNKSDIAMIFVSIAILFVAVFYR